MKTWMLVVFVAALVLFWGYYGAQQARKAEYNCQVRVESFCFVWEKSEIGEGMDRVRDLVDRNVDRQK